MPAIRFFWLAVALAALGFILIWLGAFSVPPLIWAGLALFAVAMLLGPLSRYLGRG